jgi:hypothetical protein
MAVFNLGSTEVQVARVGTPTVVAGARAVQERLTLEEAQAQVAFAIPQPASLPAGYRLREVNGYSYPDLPAWVPRPFFVELVYGAEGEAACSLRVYPIMLGQGASTAGMNLEATSIQEAQDVEIDGSPGVFMRLGEGWQEVVWEQGDLILALSSLNLTRDELLRIAASVQ